MNAKSNGGQAFPSAVYTSNEETAAFGSISHPGMTMRDYFAAKAMQGAFTSPIEATEGGKDYIAQHAYRMADAMLRAREAA